MSNLVFVCEKNPAHRITSPLPRTECLAVVHGSPCRGELRPAKPELQVRSA